MGLFGQSRRCLSCMSKPLVPLRSYFDVGVLYIGGVFDYASHAADSDGIVKFPVRISLKVKTCCSMKLAPEDQIPFGMLCAMSDTVKDEECRRRRAFTDKEAFSPGKTQCFPFVPCPSYGPYLRTIHYKCGLCIYNEHRQMRWVNNSSMMMHLPSTLFCRIYLSHAFKAVRSIVYR